MANIDKRTLDELDPIESAEDLEPELTAQPRLMTDELAGAGDAEAELSQDPEDLGARFLSEAVEQGSIPTESVVEEDSPTSLEEEVTEVRADGGARGAATMREFVPQEAGGRASYTRLAAQPEAPERERERGFAGVLRRSADLLRRLADRLDSNVV